MYSQVYCSTLILLAVLQVVQGWEVCDVTEPRFGAVGDGLAHDGAAIAAALAACDEVILPANATFLSGPLNITSNQVLNVQGTLLASTNVHDYPLVAPILGYGWGNDENCFPPDVDKHKIIPGSLRYAPVVGSYHATNVTITGSGTIDGQGAIWWDNCTKCHYPPGNDSSFCEIASRPKLLEIQFVDGLHVHGATSDTPLKLKDSPFWTLTPAYTQNIHIHDLHITAPMDRIGNTDGVNLDSCRNAVVENIYINNSDDGVCMKAGLDGYGMNLAIPTENVLVQNIHCAKGGRCGFAIGSEMSGGVRNVTYRDSLLEGERSINIKPSVGRGGYIIDLLFENITTSGGVSLHVGNDGVPLEPGNNFVPVVSNLRFVDLHGPGSCSLSCGGVNGSVCHNTTFDGNLLKRCHPASPAPALKPMSFTCKTVAHGQFGTVELPWGVCIPLEAPVNNDPDYFNWGPTTGKYLTLEACLEQCHAV